eukprot:COSAG01_NODE_26879_length_700_cov_1.193012_2_plen_56_part_01
MYAPVSVQNCWVCVSWWLWEAAMPTSEATVATCATTIITRRRPQKAEEGRMLSEMA